MFVYVLEGQSKKREKEEGGEGRQGKDIWEGVVITDKALGPLFFLYFIPFFLIFLYCTLIDLCASFNALPLLGIARVGIDNK